MPTAEEWSYYIPQLNFRVGDVEYNKNLIIDAIQSGQNDEVDLIIFPELALSGYPPRDLLYYSSFHQGLQQALDQIIEVITSSYVILGLPLYDKTKRLRNAAVILNSAGIKYTYFKTLLPDYDVFDESRYFYPNEDPGIVELDGVKIGLQICEDLWDHMWMHRIKVTKQQLQLGAELIINISASPYTLSKPENRLNLVRKQLEAHNANFIYVNLLGSQDDLVFDGRSFMVNKNGDLVYTAPAFRPSSDVIAGSVFNSKSINPDQYESIHQMESISAALQISLVDYLEKSGLTKSVLIALSGGIDSALTVTLATYALGSENVTAVYLPTSFSAKQSYMDSKQLCENLGIELLVIEIEDIRNMMETKLQELAVIDDSWSIANENIQSRIRGNLMMFLSNKLNKILLATGNKSEIATGYYTLYGDDSGGKNLLGDLYKTQVYELAKYFNREEEVIPESIITRPPSAELRPDQKDQDSLPDYSTLDEILYRFIDQYQSTEEIIAAGYDKETVKQVISLVMRNEFKRAQLVQTVKVSDRTFGFGRRFPIANQYRP